MRRLRVRKTARAEIANAFDWYLERPPASGALRRFPYGIYFKDYPTTISVVGVMHGRRHLSTWLGRAAP